MQSEAAYWGHLVLRLMGYVVLFYTTRVVCKRHVTMAALGFSVTQHWRFVHPNYLN
ncbi:MAG: hypothetical protein KatS3mg131_2861 [Candidatus Tectimicrobiota bacterium]|nr:MAG: hypothetical protein KatS3mg131_2861 [Candidatus Tectomicrobia bacterium]